jgi:antitoxin (DNA-binding transcriptional repressor) of toxin-antitoxin stability system
MRIGIRELRDHLTATIRRVRNGKTLEIIHDGEPIALRSPVPADRLARLEHAGLLTPGTPLTKPLERFKPKTGRPSDDIISEDRDE